MSNLKVDCLRLSQQVSSLTYSLPQKQIAALVFCLVAVVVDAKPYQSYGRAAPSYSDDSYVPASRPVRQASYNEPEPSPEPYSFTYETTDEYGTTLTRTESGDAQGNVKGSYMYRDPEGIYRTVEYGDSGDGFSASIQTNEPGVVAHKAADAEYLKN